MTIIETIAVTAVLLAAGTFIARQALGKLVKKQTGSACGGCGCGKKIFGRN